MSSLAHSVILASGWRRRLIAFGGGAAGALAMPPFGFLPAIMICLSVALWLIDRAAAEHPILGARAVWSAATAGWWWGFGYFVAGLWWLGAAFLVEADLFAWALPFGVLGLPAVLACFFALGFALARLIWAPNASRIFALAGGPYRQRMASRPRPYRLPVEHARHGVGAAPPPDAGGLGHRPLRPDPAHGARRCRARSFFLGKDDVAAPCGARALAPRARGACRLRPLAGAGRGGQAGPRSTLAAHAAEPAAGCRFRPGEPRRHHAPLPSPERHRQRDRAAARHHPPRSGRNPRFPFLLDRDASALAQIAALLRPGQALITGAARMEDPLPGETVGRFFNAIQVVSHDGTVTGSYDKVHLVPFGEYLPSPVEALVRAIGLRQFVTMPGGFDARRQPPRPLGRRIAAGRSNDLLRGDLPGGDCRRGSAPGPHPERHQRCLVRGDARSLPAFRPGPPASRRGGASPRARGQYGHIGGRRSLWTGGGRFAARRRGRPRLKSTCRNPAADL